MLKTKSRAFRPSIAHRREHEPIVQDNLAVTPSMIDELASLGQPISTSSLGPEFYDNAATNDFSVDPQFVRGNGIVEIWNAEQTGRGKFRKAVAYENSHAVTV